MNESKGKAAVLEDFNGEFRILEFPRPQPGYNEITVKIEVATLCGSDVHAWKGDLGGSLKVQPPLILGHEMTGKIIEIGPGAEKDSVGQDLKVGDRIVWAHAACGQCKECTIAQEPSLCANRYIAYLNDCSRAPHFTGSFAEYGIVTQDAGRIRVPDDVKSEWASSGSCALRTVIRAVRLANQISTDDSVVIQGSGPLGLFATSLISLHNPRHLIVVGGPSARLELAREWGASHVVEVAPNESRQRRIDKVMEITGEGADIMFELAGAPNVVSEGIQMLARNAQYIVMGSLGGPPQEIDVPRLVTRGITLRGSMSGDIGDYYLAMRFLQDYQDRFNWDDLLGSRYGLHQISSAITSMMSMEEIKPVIIPTP